MSLKIEYINKSELKPYENNAKVHTTEQVQQIKKSIEQFGFNDPIAIWHHNEIIEGHGRLLAVMELENIKEVPVIRLDDLTDEQRRAYILIHNKLTMNTGFDLDVLEKRLAEITDFDMNEFGFDDIDAISEELSDFFTKDEKQSEATNEEESDTIKFVITPNEEQIDDLKEFLDGEGIEYETA